MGRCRMNPHGVTGLPRYNPTELAAWTRANVRSRLAYYAHVHSPCRKCSRTAEPGITVCQSCRMSAVRRGKKRKKS